jgi:hypothetical protein
MKMRETQLKAIKRGADKIVGFCEGLTYPARGRQFPAIVINALPKSGSTFIAKTLRQALQVRPLHFAVPGLHSRGTVDMRALGIVARGNAICHQHLPPERHIISALSGTLGRIVLNLRDPRAALVSWTHFVNEFNRDYSYLLALQVAEQDLPESYFSQPLADQLAWQADNRLPEMIEWIRLWIEAADAQYAGLSILLTDYQEMVGDTRKFFERILQFYGIAIEPEWLKIRQPKAGQWKFRVGTGKDWRTDFAPETLERVSAMVPQDWMSRFGWS